MTSQNEDKIIYPFGKDSFDDQAVFELDHQLVTGEITLEEYKRKIEEL